MWFVDELKNRIIKTSIFVISFFIGLISINLYLNIDLPPIEMEEAELFFQTVKDYTPPKEKSCRLNPLILVIKADKEKSIFLNQKQLGTLDDFSELENGLDLIFNDREIYQVLDFETNKIVKEVIIQPRDTLLGKDLLKLIDVLKQSGADPIYIDWNEELN